MDYDVQDKNTALSIWKALLKRWFLIVIALIIGLGASIAYSLVKIKPVYTATTSIVLKLAMSDKIESGDNTNNASLAKRNLPTVKECLISSKCADAANAYYNVANNTRGSNVFKSGIQVSYGDSSMIFTLGYTDATEELAREKLEAVIVAAPSILAEEIEAESVDLIPVQKGYDVSASDNKARTIVIGGIAGFVMGVGLALLIYLLDNKVRTKEEIESLTGVTVIAYINNDIK